MFDLGDVVPLRFQIKDSTGALADATTVTLNITQPDATIAGPFTITPTTTGVYDYDYPTVMPGRHLARAVAIGTNACAFSDAFDVAAADPGFVISLADAKTHLRIDQTQTSQDEELRLYLGAIADVVVAVCGPVVPQTVVEIRECADEIVLYRAPAQSLTSVAWTFTESNPPTLPTYVLDAAPGILRMQPQYPGSAFYPYGWDYCQPWGKRLTITYVAGYATVPYGLQLAVRMILGELWDARRGAGPSTVRGGGEELPIPSNADILNTDAIQLLEPFRAKLPRIA